MYVKRDEHGQIVAASISAEANFDEHVDDQDSQLQAFIESLRGQTHDKTEATQLRSSDVELARVVEDIINLLTDKGVIQFTELPKAAQEKLLQRRILRRHIRHLDLVDDDTDQLLP